LFWKDKSIEGGQFGKRDAAAWGLVARPEPGKKYMVLEGMRARSVKTSLHSGVSFRAGGEVSGERDYQSLSWGGGKITRWGGFKGKNSGSSQMGEKKDPLLKRREGKRGRGWKTESTMKRL